MKKLLTAVAQLPLRKRVAVVALSLIVVFTWAAACYLLASLVVP
jgi:hypothetical protein